MKTLLPILINVFLHLAYYYFFFYKIFETSSGLVGNIIMLFFSFLFIIALDLIALIVFFSINKKALALSFLILFFVELGFLGFMFL